MNDQRLLETDDQRRAYLAGVFLSSGSVNNPDTSNYQAISSIWAVDALIAFTSFAISQLFQRLTVFKKCNT